MERARRRPWTYALWGGVAIGLAVVLYVIATLLIKHGGPPDLNSLAKGAMKGLTITPAGAPPPSRPILGPDGNSTDLTQIKAPVVVVNLWATWCAPCVTEMPTLAKLQAAYADKPVQVVAVSIDKADAKAQAQAFIAQHAPLAFYNDPDAKLPWALKPSAEGVPTTVIYGKDGLERGRISGEADWAGPGAKAVIDKLLAAS